MSDNTQYCLRIELTLWIDLVIIPLISSVPDMRSSSPIGVIATRAHAISKES